MLSTRFQAESIVAPAAGILPAWLHYGRRVFVGDTIGSLCELLIDIMPLSVRN